MPFYRDYFNVFVLIFSFGELTKMSEVKEVGVKSGDVSSQDPKQGESSMAHSNQELIKKFDSLVASGYKSIVQGTKKAQGFPSVHENSLLIASPQYINEVARTSDKVMSLVDSLLKSQNMTKSMAKLYLEGQKDILIEANDKLLESINSRIDVMAGIRTPSTVVSQPRVVKESWNKNARSSNVWQEVHEAKKKKKSSWFMLNKTAVTDRPQLNFKDKVDNSYEEIFEPKLTDKPNALKPLAILIEKYDAVESYCHPYEHELDVYVPSEKFLTCKEPREPATLDATPLVMVTEPEHVGQLVKDLKVQDEIAIDLEYHSYRSYQGYTCLMQISSREKDYIVDTLKLRDSLQVLNEVFTDKKIVKVFHGADCDIKWLQKDFGLYVVGMFDTHQACKFLPMPRQSLAYLLKHYCGVDSDKTFQLFDWRHRPLPELAVDYARSDTHYLLYVYDCMKQDLASAAHGKQNLILSTFSNSRNICKLKYNKPVFDENGYMNIFRSHSILNNQQRHALRELYKWRDRTAREKDESTGYLLPNHMLLQMAQSIPRDVQGIFACCNPVPQGVKEHVLELHAVILKARLQPLTKTVEKSRVSLVEKKKKEVTPPHDSMDALNYKGLPPVFPDKITVTKLGKQASEPHTSSKHKSKTGQNDDSGKGAQIGLFFEDSVKVKSSKFAKIKLKTSRFETPYQRFLKSKEYARALQEKLDKENAEKQKQEAAKPPASVPAPLINIKQEKVVLKQIKSEEKVEAEKEKRKKILQEREDGEQPAAKKIKVENPDETVEEKIKTEPKEKSKQQEPKENVDKLRPVIEESNNKTKDNVDKKKPTVDYSKVNYNKKYMAKPSSNINNNQNGKKNKGKAGKGNKKKKQR